MSKRKPNKIRCDGDVCYLSMYRGVDDSWHTTTFDAADLDKVSPHKWSVMVEWNKRIVPFNFYKRRLHTYLMGKEKGMEVDHINRDTLDNRRCNLRLVTHRQNMWNTNDNRNVYFAKDRNKWRVEVTENGIKKSLGAYSSRDEAKQVRADWEAIHMVIV